MHGTHVTHGSICTPHLPRRNFSFGRAVAFIRSKSSFLKSFEIPIQVYDIRASDDRDQRIGPKHAHPLVLRSESLKNCARATRRMHARMARLFREEQLARNSAAEQVAAAPSFANYKLPLVLRGDWFWASSNSAFVLSYVLFYFYGILLYMRHTYHRGSKREHPSRIIGVVL